jgi:predicted ATPase
MAALKKTDLYIKGLKIAWDEIDQNSYLRNIRTIAGISSLTFHAPITFFVGENGSGKSTLLEAMAVAYGFNPEGGTVNYNFSTYDSHSELCDALTLSKSFQKVYCGYYLRAESFYNVATMEEEYSETEAEWKKLKLHKKSHGESFLQLVQNNFSENGVYLLDEPEAALSPQRQLSLLLEIVNCAKQGSQFIMVTHSPILLGIPGAEIFSFDEGLIHPIAYEDTDSYQITRLFIENKEQLLKRLLD